MQAPAEVLKWCIKGTGAAAADTSHYQTHLGWAKGQIGKKEMQHSFCIACN